MLKWLLKTNVIADCKAGIIGRKKNLIKTNNLLNLIFKLLKTEFNCQKYKYITTNINSTLI